MRRGRYSWGRVPLLLIPLLVVLPGLSCGGGAKKGVHPVQGQVLLDGKAVPNAIVVFHRVGETNPQEARPYGRTDQEGRFSIQTYLDGNARSLSDGAPAGKYKVVVAEAADENQPVREEIGDDNPRRRRPSRIPAQYANPETSGLSVNVNEGRNELAPFELKRR
jgi:hypothetical protein